MEVTRKNNHRNTKIKETTGSDGQTSKARRGFDAPSLNRKTELAAPADRCAVVPSSQNSDLPIFRVSDTLYKPVGWHCNERNPKSASATLPPLLGDKGLGLDNPDKEFTFFLIHCKAIDDNAYVFCETNRKVNL